MIQEERQRKKEEQQAKEAAAQVRAFHREILSWRLEEFDSCFVPMQERRRQLEAERLARLEEMQQKKLEQVRGNKQGGTLEKKKLSYG